ncbi:putative 2-oxoglutarate ferredoxin oxidoreductase beta subunit [Caldilinea aerophila DSM 14535 = NBRC 104270]|uniref:Putative 2-oxoglutarate ferredoxin oxidoreductase beta subunit n=2 Tax=Caldilineaceae TaxID=475964 RepID=I0I5T2_CALAS|nr:putative 2-oxoglutarate ferredoxin oxidoreductase beta subunit [Caldilinea aerophila DSM 14535 = NBRC 104270]
MPSEMEIVYERPVALADVPMHYCPGCSHGAIHRIIAEVVDELAIRERILCVAPVGCAVFAYKYFNFDSCEAAHGRAPAMATGLKRVLPDRIVFTYQGDGDLASIGGNEILHAALRGEQISVIFVNNAVYGMTGGQMAPTTLAGMKTTSSPLGRDPRTQGHPIHITEMLASVPGVAYAVRRSMHSAAEIRKTKKAIRLAFEAQRQGLGLSIVEILAACPTNWRLTPIEALDFIRDRMVSEYPVGDFKVDERLRNPA